MTVYFNRRRKGREVKRSILMFAVLPMLLWGYNPGSVFANGIAENLKFADDITKETIVGPGSIQVNTRKDLLMSFGATVRLIPTSESDWDFGISNHVDGLLQVAPGVFGLGKNFLKDHGNETGWVNNSYIRSESKLYFNAMPKDRKWSFAAALEFDRPLDTQSVDDRGGRDKDTSNFGLERLHISYALPWSMRLNAGWDVWHLDAFKGGGLVYGDDNPGFWLTGGDDTYDDKLQGYNGVINAQRYSTRWGGENTIIGDTNLVLGSILYGYLPELYGNGTPVFTGGLQNYAGTGNGRGDNPGMTMVSTGFTLAPKKYLIYKTNVNMFHWNEDFQVTNIGLAPGLKTRVEAGYVGTEWDNELTLGLTGVTSDDTAMRLAAEFIVKF